MSKNDLDVYKRQALHCSIKKRLFNLKYRLFYIQKPDFNPASVYQ